MGTFGSIGQQDCKLICYGKYCFGIILLFEFKFKFMEILKLFSNKVTKTIISFEVNLTFWLQFMSYSFSQLQRSKRTYLIPAHFLMLARSLFQCSILFIVWSAGALTVIGMKRQSFLTSLHCFLKQTNKVHKPSRKL